MTIEQGQMDGKQDMTIESSGSVSFDDFDRMESAREEFKEAKTEEKKVEGEPEKAKQEDEKENKEKVESKKEVKEQEKEVKKMLKLLSGDKELEIPEDSFYPVKINGKVENIPLTKLAQNFSGHTDWTKKYSELNKEKIAFNKDSEKIGSLVTKFNELAKGDDILAPLSFLIDTGKGDAYTYIEKMRNHFYKEFAEMENLSDEAKEALTYKRKLEFLESRNKSQREQTEQDAVKQQQTQKTAKLLQDNNISDDDFDQVSDYLKQSQKRDFSPEQVVEYMTKFVPAAKTEKAVLELLGDKFELKDDQKNLAWDIAFNNPEFSPDDIVEILSDHFKEQKKKNREEVLAEKVRSERTTTTQKAKGYESFEDFI